MDLLGYIDQRGVDLRPFAQDLGLDIETFSRVGHCIPLERLALLFEDLSVQLDDDLLGLNFSQANSAIGVSSLSYGMQSAPTLRHSLEFMIKFRSILIDLAYVKMEIGKKTAIVEWTFSPFVRKRNQFSDLLIAMTVRNIVRICPTPRVVRQARVERSEPQDTSLHKKLLAPDVIFDQPSSMLILDSKAMDRPNPYQDSGLHALMIHECQTALETLGAKDIISLVIEAITDNLADGNLTLGQLAPRIGVSERSLQRSLQQRGQGFHNLVEMVRQETAHRYLVSTELSFSEISYRLGFSAPSAFTRSSLRWFGKTPSVVRKSETV